VTEADRRIAGRYTVQSVARALRLVEIVAEGPPGGLSLSELSRALGTSRRGTLPLPGRPSGSATRAARPRVPAYRRGRG